MHLHTYQKILHQVCWHFLLCGQSGWRVLKESRDKTQTSPFFFFFDIGCILLMYFALPLLFTKIHMPSSFYFQEGRNKMRRAGTLGASIWFSFLFFLPLYVFMYVFCSFCCVLTRHMPFSFYFQEERSTRQHFYPICIFFSFSFRCLFYSL